MFLPLNGTAISPSAEPGKFDAVTKKEVQRTSSPIAIPVGAVIVTLHWFALAPPPIRLALKSSIAAILSSYLTK